MGAYYKNEQTYSENNRIKTIKVEIKPLGENWVQAYQSDYLEDTPYRHFYFENMFDVGSYEDLFIVDFFDITTNPEIERVRITIEDVYPGSKYNDTCVSEILFLK